MRVRKLIWGVKTHFNAVETDRPGWDICAESVCGKYNVGWTDVNLYGGPSKYFEVTGPSLKIRADSEQHGRDIAQSDFEKRILGAIEENSSDT